MNENHYKAEERFIQALTESQPRLYAYILTLLADHDAAQDVLQNTNMVLWKKSDEFDPETNFIAWSSSVAYYEVLAFRKRRANSRHLFNDDVLEQVAIAAEQSSEVSPDKSAALQECLKKLPSDQLNLIRQRYETSGSVSAMAKKFERTEGSLIQSLYRIRRRLADCIEHRLLAQE